jgi:hypothetical protein
MDLIWKTGLWECNQDKDFERYICLALSGGHKIQRLVLIREERRRFDIDRRGGRRGEIREIVQVKEDRSHKKLGKARRQGRDSDQEPAEAARLC